MCAYSPFRLFLSKAFLLLLCCLSILSAHALADEPQGPYFQVVSEGESDSLPLLMTAVDVDIVGFVADVTVTQYYKNDGLTPLEAIYLFPGSTRGAVYAMTMTVGERLIEASVEEKGKAREVYQQALTEGKTTSLLEQNQADYFQTRVGNILPGDDIRVTLKYTETLIPDRGLYRFRFPHIRQAGEGASMPADTGLSGASVNETDEIGFDVTVRIQAGMAISYVASDSHPVDVEYQHNAAEIRLRDDGFFATDRDFVLDYRLSGERIQSGLLLYQGQEENYFLLLAEPPAKVSAADIPPREYIFIVDVSGSMAAYPLATAK
ncbi:MAG: hypothetical protein Tsb002_27990 [Wenzhouxiangellaceae bacterium]